MTIAIVNTLRLESGNEGGLPLAKAPCCPDGGEGRYRHRNVKEAVTPLLRGVLLQPSLLSRIQIPAAFSARFAMERLLKLDFRSSRDY
jgi:hypothetical protein